MSIGGSTNRNHRYMPKSFDINLFVPLQKLVQRFLFHKYVKLIANSQFLDNFQIYSFNRVLKFSNSDNDLKLGFILY